MKIYTKTGDKGETGLMYGGRVPKDAARVEAYGTVDELNACLGVALALCPVPAGAPATGAAGEDPAAPDSWPQLRALLATIQHQLFDVGADLSVSPAKRDYEPRTQPAWVTALEAAIDDLEATLPPLRNFILPGGSSLAAALHLARTVCRRAERRVVTLAHAENIDGTLVQYLNRLSDLLFVLARVANNKLGVADVTWQSQ